LIFSYKAKDNTICINFQSIDLDKFANILEIKRHR